MMTFYVPPCAEEICARPGGERSRGQEDRVVPHLSSTPHSSLQQRQRVMCVRRARPPLQTQNSARDGRGEDVRRTSA